MSVANLIHSPAARAVRAADKRRRFLRWLRDFTWTTVPVAQAVLRLKSRPNALKTVRQMEKEDLITVHALPVVEGREVLIIGLAPGGLLWSHDEDEPYQERPLFEPARVTLFTLQHRVDIQTARLQAEGAGWKEWTTEYCLPKEWEYKPDGVVTSSSGIRVAVEVERNPKWGKRYRALIRSHLGQIKEGRYEAVHYVCPPPGLAPRLSNFFDGVEVIENRRKEKVSFAGGPLRDRFQFYNLKEWPHVLQDL